VVAAVRRRHPEIWVSVSATTRRPRPGEIDGRHYHFLDDARFDALIEAGEFLEYATYGRHRYGTLRDPVLRTLADGRPALLEIDLQGARQVRAAMPDARLLFLAPPDWDELVRRLTGRATESPDVVEERLATARYELAEAAEFDKQLVNDDVDAVADQLVAWMLD
jgi:guanylate kinase